MRRLLALLTLGAAASAGARDADGFLYLIHSPNDGSPAVLAPGESFEAALTGEMPLLLTNDSGSYALEPQWERLPDGGCRAACAVPAAAAPGLYALEAGEGAGADRNERAVCIVETSPESYLAAHIAAPRIGSERHERPAAGIFTEVAAAVNASGAALALISGDLTEHGDPAELRGFLEVLNTCTIPTFVSPGPRDRAVAVRAFGPAARTVRYGHDGFLAFGGQDTRVSGEFGAEDARVQRLRRVIKPSRWSIGLCDSCGRGMGMRAQMTLFLDDPLDHVLCGPDGGEGEEPALPPWGTVPVTQSPPSLDGFMRLINVTPTAIVPRDPRPVAKVK